MLAIICGIIAVCVFLVAFILPLNSSVRQENIRECTEVVKIVTKTDRNDIIITTKNNYLLRIESESIIDFDKANKISVGDTLTCGIIGVPSASNIKTVYTLTIDEVKVVTLESSINATQTQKTIAKSFLITNAVALLIFVGVNIAIIIRKKQLNMELIEYKNQLKEKGQENCNHIKYTVEEKDNRLTTASLFLFMSKIVIALATVFILNLCCLLFVSIKIDKEMLGWAPMLIAGVGSCIMLFVAFKIRCERSIKERFAKYQQYGKIDYSIEYKEHWYRVVCLNQGANHDFHCDFIKRKQMITNKIILKLKNGLIVDLPNTPEIRAILEQ